MPKLPDWTAVGQPALRESGRPTASIATNQAGAGLMSMAAGVNKIGGYAQKIADQKSAEDDAVGTANATAYLLKKKHEFDEKIRQEPDKFAEWDNSFKDHSKKALSDAGALIKDSGKRRLWQARHQVTVQGWNEGVKRQAFGQERDANLAFNQKTLDDFKNRALDPKTSQEDKAMYIDTAKGVIEDSRARGYISDQQAKALGDNWLQGYAIDRSRSMTPDQRIKEYGGDLAKSATPKERTVFDFFVGKGLSPQQSAAIVGNLIQESSLRTGARNPRDGRDGSDSIGIAQWNGTRAQALKAFASRMGKPVTDPKVQLEFVWHELNTSEAGTLAKLRAARTVDDATAAFIGYERPQGWTSNNPRGGHGWSNRFKHAQRVFGGPGDVAKILNPAQRQAIVEGAYREQSTNARKDKMRVQGLVADHLDAISNTGQGMPPEQLNPDMVGDILGHEQARWFSQEQDRRKKVYEALSGIERLSDDDINQRLSTLQPRLKGAGKSVSPDDPDEGATPDMLSGKTGVAYEGYTDDLKSYEAARKKAQGLIEARRRDPALAVRDFDNVAETRGAFEYENKNGIKVLAPSSAQELIRQRFIAQQQIGIEAPMAVTKQEADVIARQLRLISADDREGMAKFLSELERTFGEYADEVLAATFQHARVGAELSRFAGSVLMGLQRGVIPSTADARNYDALVDMDELESKFPDYRPQQNGPGASAYGVPRNSPLGRTMAPDAPAKPKGKPDDGDIPAPDRIHRNAMTDDILKVQQGRLSLPELRQKYGTKVVNEAISAIKKRTGVSIGD